MRPWLLLLPLFVSDLSLRGDGDGVMENCSWRLCRKLLLNGRMTPRGPEILQTEHHCMCIHRDCVDKQRTSPFDWEHGCSLSHQESAGIIHRDHIPAPVVSLLCAKGKSVAASLVKSYYLVSQTTPSQAAGEISPVATGTIKDRPDSERAWFLHHHRAASGHSSQKSESWAPATIVQLCQKVLTKRSRAATSVLISCCFKESEIRSSLKTSRGQIAQPQIRQEESSRRAADVKVPMKHDGRQLSKASVSQHDIFQAATLHPGSSSVITPHASQLQIQRKAARIMKKNLSLDDEPWWKKRQQPLKAASSVYNDDADGFYVHRQLLLASREKTESINRPRYKIKATQGENKEDFSGKIITKQAELRRPEGERETERSRTNTIENGNQNRLAYILQEDFTHKTDNNDHKQMLTEVGEDVLITLFLPDTQKETQRERKVILKTDTGWKTGHIRDLGDPSLMTEVIKHNFIIKPDNSKCKCLKESLFSIGMYALNRRERMEIRAAESTVRVTTHTEEQVKETTNNTPHENTSRNHSKQEENVPPVVPPPPSLKLMEADSAKAETTTVNMEIKETTSSAEVFNQKTDGPTPRTEESPTTTTSPHSGTDPGPTFIRCKTNDDTRAATERSLSGLRMREDVPARLHRGAEEERRDAERKQEQNDPKQSSFPFRQTIHKQAAAELPKTMNDNMPPCRGLIHRTEAGWKHCVERFAGAGSKKFSSWEPTDAFKDRREEEKEALSIRGHKDDTDDGYDHFYYFDGVLKRVQNNYYPYYKRKRSQDNTVFTLRKKRDTRENLHGYIQRLTSRNKESRFK